MARLSLKYIALSVFFVVILYVAPYLRRLDKPPTENTASNIALPHPSFQNTFVDALDPLIYNPYPEYNSVEWLRHWKGPHILCNGPRKKYVNNDPNDMILAHVRPPDELTQLPLLGSYDALNPSVCFDSRSRYRPYGYDQEDVISPESGINWDDVDWGGLQRTCITRNGHRFEGFLNSTVLRWPQENLTDYVKAAPAKKPRRERSAIVVQPDSTNWTVDSIQYLRSLIMELNLHTGGEFELVLLITTSDGTIAVPREFHSLSIPVEERMLNSWYSINSTYQPVQLLSLARPDLEYFWLLDIDARYTGHYYELLDSMATWAKQQPEDLGPLFYIPEVHHTWTNFTKVAKVGKHMRKNAEADLITVVPVEDAQPISRMSRRLLQAMHNEQLGGNNTSPVMTAFNNGYKATTFPLPIFSKSRLSPQEVDMAVNHGKDFVHFEELTFSSANGPTYADELYKRWLGYDKERTEGLCIPGMLLHPIQGV